jgi:hypothetical protein
VGDMNDKGTINVHRRYAGPIRHASVDLGDQTYTAVVEGLIRGDRRTVKAVTKYEANKGHGITTFRIDVDLYKVVKHVAADLRVSVSVVFAGLVERDKRIVRAVNAQRRESLGS